MFKVTKAEVNKDGTMNIVCEDNRTRCSIYNLSPTITEVDVNRVVKPLGIPHKRIVINGTFESNSYRNTIENIAPIEVTLEEVAEKFGRRVKIVDKK